MFSIDFFLLNSNPMSASLKNLGIFLIQGQRSISGSNMIIQQIKVGTSVLHKFHCEFACAIHF